MKNRAGEGLPVELIQLNCPNCNGKIEYKEGQSFKCPFCETEIMLKENKVYYVDQTINHYYGTAAPNTATRPKTNLKALLIVPIVFLCAFLGYFLLVVIKQSMETMKK